jgi:Xaa-Pro aminopeptidase
MTPDEIKWLNDYHARVRDVVRAALDEPTRTWLEAATKPL